MSNTARDIGVSFKATDIVADIKKRLIEKIGITTDIRLFMFGKPLREDTALVAQGWDNHIVQAFVRE